MKKAIYLKSIFLLCLLLAGAVSAHADGYDYDCEKVTDLSDVSDGETVLLVDESKNLALSPREDIYGLKGVEIAIGEDNVIRNMPANIIWTIENQGNNSFYLKNNNEYLWGSLQSPSVSFSTPSSFSDATNVFQMEGYDENGGKLYYEGVIGASPSYQNFFCWSQNNSQLISIDDNTTDRFTLYKVTIKNYVKWKMVNGLDVVLSDDDVVVIADQNSAKAMSNDKKDKEPDAVAVNLNDSKDRILGDVAEKVQWTFTNVGGDYHFAVGEKNLYADNEGLKVGSETTNNGFSFSNNGNGSYMGINIDNTLHIAGVDASMFSNVWKLVTEDDDLAKNTQIAIFKKVEDPQKIVKIELPEYYNYDLKDKDLYTLDERDFNEKVTITGADKSEIKWKSSNTDVIEINEFGYITQIKKRGTAVITAYVEEDTENYTHDKASAKCTVIVDDNREAELGTIRHPLTVAEAKELAETGEIKIDDDFVVLRWEEGVNYYIKGKVSKVNSGMMAMFGDMDFGEMMGGSGSEDSMDDMDFDPEDMEESGFDMSSFDMSSFGFDMSAMFGTSDKVTYYISDDGTKDGQMKVINGCGTLSEESTGGEMKFNPIPKLSPGDCVVVCGPLVNTEDTNMFSGMMGGNSSEEPEMSGKVDEMNYLAVYDPTLLVEDKEIYVNKSLKVVDGGYTDYLLQKGLYSIDNLFDKYDGQHDEVKITDLSQIKEATFKSSDEDIVKWDEDKKELVGVNEGKAKITVKVKVVLQEADDQANPKVEEKSYTMKRKFKVIVKTRDLDPAGYYDGEWVLTTQEEASELKEGTRLVLVGTRVKDDKATDYMMVENNAMMGGGKNGSKIEFDEPTIPSSTVTSKKGLEVILEKDEENPDFWNLKVGIDENNKSLFLYATESSKEEEPEDPEDDNKFDMNKIMEMFSPSSGMKVGTKDDAAEDAKEEDAIVSLKASISFNDKNAIIKFIFDGFTDDTKKNNTIMLSSSFDMEEMMGMFGGMGNKEEETTTEDDTTEDDDNNEKSTFDMGSFDMFMASFNTKKPGDEQAKEDEETHETKAPKCFMPRIYRFVPYNTYDISIGSTEWKTIVSYKDVSVPDNVEAYIVTKVTPKKTQSVATLSPVQIKDGKQVLKGGEPYLLHSTSGNYTLTLLTPNDPDELEAPEGNLLWKSDRKTSGEDATSTVYVLANKSLGVGFYKWIGGDLGAGRVYLTGKAHENPNTTNAHEFVGFFVDETGEATAIESIDDFKANVGPFYDLQGRRVDNPTKGIYIVNGKKVIVK